VLDRISDLLALLLSGCTGVEDRWLDFAHVDCRLKIVDERLLALNASVGQLADLLRVEAFPHLAGEVIEQLHHKKGVAHVDEGVPHVAVVLEVDRQVEEVVPACVLLVQPLQKHLLRVLVWNVLDHDCRSRVAPARNLLQIQLKRLAALRLKDLLPLAAVERLRFERELGQLRLGLRVRCLLVLQKLPERQVRKVFNRGVVLHRLRAKQFRGLLLHRRVCEVVGFLRPARRHRARRPDLSVSLLAKKVQRQVHVDFGSRNVLQAAATRVYHLRGCCSPALHGFNDCRVGPAAQLHLKSLPCRQARKSQTNLLGVGCVSQQPAGVNPFLDLLSPVWQIRIVELDVVEIAFVVVGRAVRGTNRVINFLVEQFEGLFVFGAVVGAPGRGGLRGSALVARGAEGGLAVHALRTVFAGGVGSQVRGRVRDF